ncbi:MAG TPA: alternative ribosome rescue aminoacyl-tRNA hydrolase ArfB [Caulobacteraceae bacterium]|nr:alternative ribosome rescue aminoacyl-tRNA hydrolase ArfB [Caulobacteraceae bacterium]
MISVTDEIAIDERELEERFVLASGPGGQNVNKTSSAVQLRFDARGSPNLPNDVSIRLQKLAGGRLTMDGVIVIVAARFSSQERNRADARERLVELIRKAAVRPIVRRKTRPSAAARRLRVDAKTRRGAIKSRRGKPAADD